MLIGLGILAWKRKDDGPIESRPRMTAPTFWLLAWSLGGLFVMSLVPSKRIDRIFPILPPLSLLLGVIVGRLRETLPRRIAIDRVCAIAVVVAALAMTGYAARKVKLASREHSDAFAVFGRGVVKEVAAHRWTYGVVGGEEEGMLLYVRKTEFLEPDQAATDWNAGKLDALILPDDEAADLLPRLQGNPRKLLESGPAGRYRKRYFLLAR